MIDRPTHAPKAQTDLIAGEWVPPEVILETTLDDPNTGEPRQQQVATSPQDVERALAAADALHATGSWAYAPIELRVRVLEDLAAGLEARVDELAHEDAMANGNAIKVAAQMASYLGPRVRSARDQLLEIGDCTPLEAGGRDVRLLRRPLGTAAILAPWNAPTFVAVAKVASALAAGCPVILKPSEWAPAGCQVVAEILAGIIDRLDLPQSVFQLVHGGAQVGAQIAADSRVKAISFTGGGAGGRAVATAAAPNLTALQLELGGHNPALVLPDADIAATAVALADGMTKLNGQWCEAPGKILVPAALHDDLVEALLTELQALEVGHCLANSTDVGPLAYSLHRNRLQRQVDDLASRGGKPLTSAALPDLGGWFFAPTVIVGLDADTSRQELFGPAVTVHAVDTPENQLRASHGPETGLAGFVFGTDLDRAVDVASRVPSGEVRVNGCKLADLADGSEQTFWNGTGLGGHGPTDMVRFFQGRQTVGVDDPALPV